MPPFCRIDVPISRDLDIGMFIAVNFVDFSGSSAFT
jgi:hypothetical protein